MEQRGQHRSPGWRELGEASAKQHGAGGGSGEGSCGSGGSKYQEELAGLHGLHGLGGEEARNCIREFDWHAMARSTVGLGAARAATAVAAEAGRASRPARLTKEVAARGAGDP